MNMGERRLRRIAISYKALSIYLRGETQSPTWSSSPADLRVEHVYPMIGTDTLWAVVSSEDFAEILEGVTPPDFVPHYGNGTDKPDGTRYTLREPEEIKI